MAEIFHDDCSSTTGWTPYVVWSGALTSDGDCLYMTQGALSGMYIAGGVYDKSCTLGTKDFEIEVVVKMDSISTNNVFGLTLLNVGYNDFLEFTIDFEEQEFSVGSHNARSTASAPASYGNTTKTYTMKRKGNKLQMLDGEAVLAEYTAEEVETVDIGILSIAFRKVTATNESNAKTPAVFDIKVFEAEPEEPEEPIIDDVIPSYPPASYIKLQFQAGDSEKYDMGIFYTDKTRYRVGDPGAKVNARNSVGKYLRDQTFDERNNYSPMRLDDLLKKILTGAGITDFYVAPNSTQIGMQFAPNKSILDGIEEILAYAPGWVIREEVTGRVVIGPKDDPEFTQPSRYTFQRDRDIFSREQIKDDQLIYGRVCVHVADFAIKVYRAVTSALGWLPPAQKTYYQVVPDGTTSQEAAALATELADSMADSGEIETFVCPFRPHLIPGDEAEILDSDGATFLGVITQVKHDFGAGGFYTTITVDSGGRIGRPRFKDLVNAINSVTTISHKL